MFHGKFSALLPVDQNFAGWAPYDIRPAANHGRVGRHFTREGKRMNPNIGMIAVTVTLAAACNSLPTAPNSPGTSDGLDRPTGSSYRISGTISAFRGGPLSGVSVYVYPCNINWGIPCSTLTDAQGHYVISSPGAATASLSVGRRDFQTAWKSRLTAQDSTADFVLHPELVLHVAGDIVSDSIGGDEFVGGDDVLFGGVCERRPCKVLMFQEFPGNARPVELRLRWNDPTRQLTLYKYDGNPDSIPSPQKPPERYTGPSELSTTVFVQGYFDALAVAFEGVAGGTPQPADSQSFELSVISRASGSLLLAR
jgi:hypothetical protein